MEIFLVFQKLSVSIFFGLFVFLLAFWCLPEGYFFRDLLHKYMSKYICWAALDNYWALFAPRPVSKNFLIGFELEFANGKVESWRIPEYQIKYGYQVAPHFRFIKFHNQLLSQKDEIPKRAMCDFVFRKYLESTPNNILPCKIHIIRFYEPFNKSLISDWLSQRVYTYHV